MFGGWVLATNAILFITLRDIDTRRSKLQLACSLNLPENLHWKLKPENADEYVTPDPLFAPAFVCVRSARHGLTSCEHTYVRCDLHNIYTICR